MAEPLTRGTGLRYQSIETAYAQNERLTKQISDLTFQVMDKSNAIMNLRVSNENARDRIKVLEANIWAANESERSDAQKALLALSGAGIVTPAEGYGTNSSWAISDLCAAIKAQKEELKAKDQSMANICGRNHALNERVNELEEKLTKARTGIENVSAQARLCLNHVGIAEHQKKWIKGEISNEERIALGQILLDALEAKP